MGRPPPTLLGNPKGVEIPSDFPPTAQATTNWLGIQVITYGLKGFWRRYVLSHASLIYVTGDLGSGVVEGGLFAFSGYLTSFARSVEYGCGGLFCGHRVISSAARFEGAPISVVFLVRY